MSFLLIVLNLIPKAYLFLRYLQKLFYQVCQFTFLNYSRQTKKKLFLNFDYCILFGYASKNDAKEEFY